MCVNSGADCVQMCMCFAWHDCSIPATTYESRCPSEPSASQQERAGVVLPVDGWATTSLSGIPWL